MNHSSHAKYLQLGHPNNTELNDLRKVICLRKSEASVDRNVIENFTEHGIHFLPCSYTNDVINMLP